MRDIAREEVQFSFVWGRTVFGVSVSGLSTRNKPLSLLDISQKYQFIKVTIELLNTFFNKKKDDNVGAVVERATPTWMEQNWSSCADY